MDRNLFALLEDLSVLRHLPTAILGLVVKYVILPPVQGRLVGHIALTSSDSGSGGHIINGGPFGDGGSAVTCSEATGELLVLDTCNNRVQVFSLADMSFIREWGTRGSEPGQFDTPRGICVDEKTGRVLVADCAGVPA